MTTKTKIQSAALAIAAAVMITLSARANPDFYNVSANSTSCFQRGGTIPVQISSKNISSAALPGYQLNVCANVQLFGISPGSANQPPGGTSNPATCSLGNARSLAVTGNWPANFTNSWFVPSLAPTNGQPASFQIAVSDGTHSPVTTGLSIPQCAANGPVLQITKTLFQSSNLSLGQARTGDKVEFDITVTNTGTSATTGDVTVTDNPPDGLQRAGHNFGNFTGSYSDVGQNGSVFTQVVPIAPGSSLHCTVTYIVEEANDFVNTATVSGGGAPPGTSSASLTSFGPRFSNRLNPRSIRDFTGTARP